MTGGERHDADGATEAEYETLKLEYEKICDSHQAITDFRGKLLGLLPLAAGAGIFLLLNKPISAKDQAQVAVLLAAAGAFGVAVTIGLYFYERRGMVECHLLRIRGAQLEHEMRLRRELSRFQSNRSGFVGPHGAGPIVYFAVVTAWAFVAVYGFLASSPARQKIAGAALFILYLCAVIGTFMYNKRIGLLKDDALGAG
jgi:hypothetical protein